MEQRVILSAGSAGRFRLTRSDIRARLDGRTVSTRGNGTPERDNIRAAVLVPLVERDEGWFVVLTLRSADLADHAGQISLPGGRIEPEDADPRAAALREAEEEIGLARDYVETAGRLDTWLTGTGFEVTPIVGMVRPPPPYRPDPVEVAEVFEVPLDFILDTRNHQWRSRQLQGQTRYFWAIPYLHRNIWGVTASMLVNLAEALNT
ncbi:MAG TPA: CoA pyrophosphatase [Stellaceae bacterium]|jgi:8-oxo-dGTP pyrophosphatase MutT (NUDIX family)|nr:CoA pyrophosphatase [Stellaceae bacterium]